MIYCKKYDGESYLPPGYLISIFRNGPIKLKVLANVGDNFRLLNITKNYRPDPYLKPKRLFTDYRVFAPYIIPESLILQYTDLKEYIIRVYGTKSMCIRTHLKDIPVSQIVTRGKDVKTNKGLVNKVTLKDGTIGWVWSIKEVSFV